MRVLLPLSSRLNHSDSESCSSSSSSCTNSLSSDEESLVSEEEEYHADEEEGVVLVDTEGLVERSEQKEPVLSTSDSQRAELFEEPVAQKRKREEKEETPRQLLADSPQTDQKQEEQKPGSLPATSWSFRRNRKRPVPFQEEEKPSALDDPTAAAAGKRPRSDSKPAAKIMAVGPPLTTNSSDSDIEDCDEFWVQPAENEPPPVQNNSAVAASYANPAEDSEEESPEEAAADGFALLRVLKVEQDDPTLMHFCQVLKKQGFEMVEQEGDGNCLFRAVSLQVFGNPDNHAEVRERCMDFMARNEEHYSNFVAVSSDDEDRNSNEDPATFQAYIARKRKNGVHGNHAEIQAISELFNRPVEVYQPENASGSSGEQQQKPMNIFHAEYKTLDPPIRLSYHDGNHYNAIIDPLVPTAGVGLGLPGLQPGLADKMQVAKAKQESDQMADEEELKRVLKQSKEEIRGAEDDELQRVLKESTYSMDYMYKQRALALSDLDETKFELEQKVLQSSMESYFRQEHGRKKRASPVVAGRRRRSSPRPPSPEEQQPTAAATAVSSSYAATIPPAAAAAAVAAAAPASSSRAVASSSSYTDAASMAVAAGLSSGEEYPQTVQELVMNGFELQKVVKAYEFIGDNFDDLLSFLLSSSGP